MKQSNINMMKIWYKEIIEMTTEKLTYILFAIQMVVVIIGIGIIYTGFKMFLS